MKIAVQTGGMEKYYNIDDTYRIISESGFDAADANVDHLLTCPQIENKQRTPAFTGTDKESIEYFRPWKEAAEKYGVDNYQAHAPFRSFINDRDGDYDEFLIDMLKKTIRGCDYIGCHCLVIHPFFLRYNEKMTPEQEWEVNVDRYSRLIPVAKEYGVTICLENMFTGYRGKIYEACCSNIETACKYIDTLNGIAGKKQFGFCLDTGHLLLLGKPIKESMIQLGDRIEAFHVHDNNGISDQHLAPYMGVLDWNEFVEGLKAINFNKTMSLETFNIWNVVDPELCPSLMKWMAQTARMFARRAAE